MVLQPGLEWNATHDLARRIEPFNLFWLEEVTPALADLAAEDRRRFQTPAQTTSSLTGSHRTLRSRR